VFKDCAKVVRVKIKYRDSTRIPAGRLFHFQGKFHQLMFEAEGEPAMVVAEDPPPPLPPPSDGSDDHGNEAQAGERQDGMETDRSNAAGNATANSTVMTPGASSSGSVVRRLVAEGEEVKEYVSGIEVYDLLLKSGCVGVDGRFVWNSGDSSSDDAVEEEVQTFLLEEQGSLADHQERDMETVEMNVDDLEAAVPHEFLPTLEKPEKTEEVDKVNKEKREKEEDMGACAS
jgi:hypothetical protein